MDAAPETSELESLLLAAFRRHVGDHLEADDDFFAGGGVSLTAAMCIAELRRDGVRVSLRELFREKSARRLAATIAPLNA